MPEAEFQVTRVSGAADRQDIYHLRYEVFVKEQFRYAATADHTGEVLTDDIDDAAEHFAVVHKGTLVAAIRVLYGTERLPHYLREGFSIDRFGHIPSDHFAFCGRLVVRPAFRGSASLFQLVQHRYRFSRERGTRVDFISCMPSLVRLYEQLGYRRYRPYFDDPALGFRIPLLLIVGDVDHMKAIRSPLYLSARKLPADPVLADWFQRTFPEYRSFISTVTVGPDRFMEIMSTKISDTDVPLLRGLDQAEREMIYAATTHLEVPAGTRLIRKGDQGKEVFLILDGVAEVRLRNGDGDLLLATCGRGDIFGEMSLVSARPRTADVIAQTKLEVVYFDNDNLNRLIKVQPALAAKLLHNLCRTLAERLEATSGQLALACLPASSLVQ